MTRPGRPFWPPRSFVLLTLSGESSKTAENTVHEKAAAMTDINLNNLDPQKFVFWQPPVGRSVYVGPEQRPVPLPDTPLPIKITDMAEEGDPTDHAIGQGVYDYLRAFPDCLDNVAYAELLRDGYQHFLADLAAHAVMLDQKDVEPAYIFRKLTCLKVLRLLEPENVGLLWQLSQGFYGLVMTFTELHEVRRYLLDAMRFGQAVIKQDPNHIAALNLLAEIDVLFGDYPTAIIRFERMLELVPGAEMRGQIMQRRDTCR